MSDGWLVFNIIVWSIVVTCALIKLRWNLRAEREAQARLASRWWPFR